jgi:hypothetical protein
MPGLGQNLLISQVFAVLLVHIVPVLLLALSGAVVNTLAPGTLLDGGLVLWLFPAIAAAVEAIHLSGLNRLDQRLDILSCPNSESWLAS